MMTVKSDLQILLRGQPALIYFIAQPSGRTGKIVRCIMAYIYFQINESISFIICYWIRIFRYYTSTSDLNNDDNWDQMSEKEYWSRLSSITYITRRFSIWVCSARDIARDWLSSALINHSSPDSVRWHADRAAYCSFKFSESKHNVIFLDAAG